MVLGAQSADLPRVRTLYERSFPANERRNFDDLLTVFGSACELLAFYEQDEFLGFAFLLTWGDLSHILYFSITEEKRGQGLGTQALEQIRQWKRGLRIIADLEAAIPGASNRDQRLRRMNFYLRNGYAASPVSYRWQGEDYVMFVAGGSMSEAEFEAFWDHFSIHPQIQKEAD